jgi:predicted SnoaL-like aldol condensation-catalyzing enzyme
MSAQRNKHLVADYLSTVWNGRAAHHVPDFVAQDVAHHGEGLPIGAKALEAFVEGFASNLPLARFFVLRLVAEGDLVVAHCLLQAHPQDTGTEIMNIYRIAENRITEQWSVKSCAPLPAMV